MWTWNDGTELYHHGILGQKWGRRNGPPYPLDVKRHSASEKKAGWRKSLNKDSKEESSKKLKLTDKQKKALIIGGVAAATALVVIGGVYLHKTGAFSKQIESGKYYCGMMFDQDVDETINPELAHKSLEAIEKSVSGCNLSGNTTNCVASSGVNELRRRGIPVHSKYRNGKNYTVSELELIFPGYKPVSVDITSSTFKESKNILEKRILEQGEGARGTVSFIFNNKYKEVYKKRFNMNSDSDPGHMFSYEVFRGKVIFSDGQINKLVSIKRLQKMLKESDLSSFEIGNLSSLPIDKDFIEIIGEYDE